MTEKEQTIFLKPTTMKPAAEHGSEVTRRFAINKAGRMLAAAMQDRSLRLYDARNCDEIQRMEDAFLCTSLAFSPRGDVLASGNVGRAVNLWDIRTGECIATLDGHTYPVLALAFSPDGNQLVSCSGDTTMKTWDIDSRTEIFTLTGHSLYVVTCDWDPNDNRIVSGSVDSSIREWDPNTGRLIKEHSDHRTAVHTVRFSPDGERFASGSSDMSIILWDPQGTPMKPIETLHGHQGEVRALAFSPDGRYITSGSSDKTLFVWLTEGYTIEGESATMGEVDGIEWYPDSSGFVSADGTGAIIRWEVTSLSDMLTPLEDLLKEIEADTDQSRRNELSQKFEEILSRYDEETLRDKRVFYLQWQCKKGLGLLKGKPREK